jgi:hypothetical protein
MTKINKILLLLQIFTLLSFTAGIVSSVQPEDARDACPDPILVNSSAQKNLAVDDAGNLILVDEEIQKEANDLAGTCPKGFCCSCASCPLFSDLDQDIFCDRGEELDL